MAPYSACVSSRPTSQRFCVVVMAASHARTSAGYAHAGASTLRASPGRTQSVATGTRTQRAGGRAPAGPAASSSASAASARTAAASAGAAGASLLSP